MIYAYARVPTDGQSVDAQVSQLRAVGAGHVFRETACGAKTDRRQLRGVLDKIDAGEAIREIARLCNVSHGTISRPAI